MKTVKCYEASDGTLFKATDFEDLKAYEKLLKMEDHFPFMDRQKQRRILEWVGSDHFYEVFPLYKDVGVTTGNAGD